MSNVKTTLEIISVAEFQKLLFFLSDNQLLHSLVETVKHIEDFLQK